MFKALPSLRQQLSSLPKEGYLAAIAPAGDFSCATLQGTAFFLSLVLHSLNQMSDPELVSVGQRLEDTLRDCRKKIGSWNYWLPDSPAAQLRPLPDDLDTTCCVLSALAKTPQSVSGEWLADAVQLLTLREVGPGGPYKTWIVASDAKDVWQDTDPVVNANIGRLLANFGASPPPLEQYLTAAIQDVTRTSPYYPDRLLFRYFLAPWYHGEAKQLLAQQCLVALHEAQQTTGLQTLALALATVCQFSDTPLKIIQQAAAELDRRCLNQAASAEALCIDAVHGNTKDYAGCTAFTLAICLEALARAAKFSQPAITRPPLSLVTLEEKIIFKAEAFCTTLPDPLAQAASAALQIELAADQQHNLTRLPFTLAGAVCGLENVCQDSNLDLGLANLFGWVSYTIYDDIADGQAPSLRLWPASAFLRQSFNLFQNALTEQSGWLDFCRAAFARMEAMNYTEQTTWRFSQQSPLLAPPPVTFAYLTERSRGVILAPLALVIRHTKLELADPLVTSLELFIGRLIAARQLCDDAHDWQDDLIQGRFNSASAQLFADIQKQETVASFADQPTRQRIFWDSTIETLTRQVDEYCTLAEQQIPDLFLVSEQTTIRNQLHGLRQSMNRAVKERDFAQDFLRAYNQQATTNLINDKI